MWLSLNHLSESAATTKTRLTRFSTSLRQRCEIRRDTALAHEQVRNVVFAKPPIGRRGYNEDEVDAFLDFVAQQLTAQRFQQGAPAPPPTGRLPARHGTARHAGDETWFRRALNAVTQFFAWIFEN